MSSDDSSKDSQPSMLSGHYVQGAVSSALGYDTGAETKASAVQEMKDAKDASSSSAQQPTQSSILGNLEAAAGKVTGCEGMVEEAQQRMPQPQEKKVGIEEQNGTG